MVEGDRDNDKNDIMYIISSWRDKLKEADDEMGDGVGWLGGNWGITLYFLSIV